MCAHEGMQVRGERIVGVWMQLTSMAARRVDDIEVCRDGSMCECLHKHSAPERRAQARAALAHTGQGRTSSRNSSAVSVGCTQGASARGAPRSCPCAKACTNTTHPYAGRKHAQSLHAQGRCAVAHIGSKAAQSGRLWSSRKARARRVFGCRIWACRAGPRWASAHRVCARAQMAASCGRSHQACRSGQWCCTHTLHTQHGDAC